MIRDILLSLIYYTRLPMPRLKEFRPDDTNRSMRFFGLVGCVVGLVCALAFLFGKLVLDPAVGVILAVAAGVLATGGFHEDGFADTLDGFGGGRRERQRILDIMKDSHIGTFGVLGLILLILIKTVALLSLLSFDDCLGNRAVLAVFVLYHTLARYSSSLVAFTSAYARRDGSGKLTPQEHKWSWKEWFGTLFFAIAATVAAMFALPDAALWIALIPVLLLILALIARGFFVRRIGGYTGDCLGFVEQCAEVIVILCLIVIVKFGYLC